MRSLQNSIYSLWLRMHDNAIPLVSGAPPAGAGGSTKQRDLPRRTRATRLRSRKCLARGTPHSSPGRSRGIPRRGIGGPYFWPSLSFSDHFVHVETGRFLPLRVILERREELAHIGHAGTSNFALPAAGRGPTGMIRPRAAAD